MKRTIVLKCILCGHPKSSVAWMSRGLCPRCYDGAYRNGTVNQYARTTWPAKDLVAEADALREAGMRRDDIARRLGVTWDAVIHARMRLKARAEREANSMVYEEHAKLSLIADKSQAIGEFVEWLGTEGVHLMKWLETTDTEECDGTILHACRGSRCDRCKGKKVVTVKRAGWAPNGISISDMLGKFFDIDRDKIEQEKRHMLEQLRKRNGG